MIAPRAVTGADGPSAAPPAPARWWQRAPVPTWRAAAVAAAATPLAAVLPLPFPWSVGALAGALLLLIAADAALAVDPRRLVIRRDAPGIVPLHAVGELRWSVANPTDRRLDVALADALAPSLGAVRRRARLQLPAHGRSAATTTITPRRRGRFDLQLVELRVAGPLGLAARQARQVVRGTIRVYPSFHSRDEAELRIHRGRILEVGLRSARGRGGGTDFDSLREYVQGDEFRRIDWAATARAGAPIVREYRAERNQMVVVLLDVGRVMAGRIMVGAPGLSPGRVEVPRLDHAMDAVMALTTVATRLGDRVGLVAFGADIRAVVPPGRARHQLRRVTEAMYRLEPELAESDYRGAFLTTLTRFRRRSMLVVLTELAAEALAESLLPALPLVVRDHLVVVASVQDPDVLRWAYGVPQDAGAAYRKAAALDALADRRRFARRLTTAGVPVVDAPPTELAGRVADTYLQAKAAGRL
ncbi:MAG TPA: DUF58 domain-containing protein [Nitriliruptorales bacterium]|nr:DUF58 domain-containing protein [Nitriliruptorales bacterium]